MNANRKTNDAGPSRGVTVDPKRFKYHRQLRGLTQKDLARKAGCVERTVWNAEHGRTISAGQFRALATAMEIEPTELLPPAVQCNSNDDLLERVNVQIEAIRQESEVLVAKYVKEFRELVAMGVEPDVARRKLFHENQVRIDEKGACRNFATAVELCLPHFVQEFGVLRNKAQAAYVRFQSLVHEAAISERDEWRAFEDDIERARRVMLDEVKEMRRGLIAAMRVGDKTNRLRKT